MAKSIADLIRSAAPRGGAEKVRVKLIVLSGATPLDNDQMLRFGEFLAPIDTFLAVRERRAAMVQWRAEDETCSTLINLEISEFNSYRSCLDFGYNLPLG